MAVIVIFKTRCGNKHQRDTYGDQNIQLEEKLITQHYENVQGTEADGDITVQYTDVEGDYTTLDRPDQETVYDELKSI